MGIREFFAGLWRLVAENRWATLLTLLLLADAAFMLSGLILPEWGTTAHLLTADAKPRLAVLGAAHVIAWTLGPPAWFFLETFVVMRPYLPDPTRTTTPEIQALLDRWKLKADMAKAFWAALLAAILFFVPK